MTPMKTASRRVFLQCAGAIAGAGALAAALPRRADAADLPHLATTDPTAVALGYTEDASKVDATKYPTHKAGQDCASCRFFGGTAQTAWAACQLFPGKAVTAKGWCSGYNPKT
jgi:High potential iron-sulfur protein